MNRQQFHPSCSDSFVCCCHRLCKTLPSNRCSRSAQGVRAKVCHRVDHTGRRSTAISQHNRAQVNPQRRDGLKRVCSRGWTDGCRNPPTRPPPRKQTEHGVVGQFRKLNASSWTRRRPGFSGWAGGYANVKRGLWWWEQAAATTAPLLGERCGKQQNGSSPLMRRGSWPWTLLSPTCTRDKGENVLCFVCLFLILWQTNELKSQFLDQNVQEMIIK